MVAIAAETGERAALARRFGLIAVDLLEARFTLRREGDAVLATGRVTAAVTQACAATGEPLVAVVDEQVALRFVAEQDVPEELELTEDALDTLPVENGLIDLGEAAAETMALALDPFARRPDAGAALAAAGVSDEDPAGPFASLAGLKRRLTGE